MCTVLNTGDTITENCETYQFTNPQQFLKFLRLEIAYYFGKRRRSSMKKQWNCDAISKRVALWELRKRHQSVKN